MLQENSKGTYSKHHQLKLGILWENYNKSD